MKLNRLKEQIKRVIPMLEARYNQSPSSLLDYVLLRYCEALDTLEKADPRTVQKDQFQFKGGLRLILEATGKYQDPMLEEMYVAEKLLDEYFSE